MRSDSRPISGNEVKRFKHLYSTRETPVAPGLVSTIQLGNDVLVPPGAWSGLEENHGKFITIQGERENPVDLVNFVIFGTNTDNSKTLQHESKV